MYSTCVFVYRLQLQHIYTRFGLSFSHVLIPCLSPSLCLSVPRRNHQKYPRGGGDDNLWPLVLSACCHRLGYEGSRDPHRISERGKHVMLHLSNSLNLINQSHSVRCKRCWKYVLPYLPSIVGVSFFCILLCCCVAEQITASCWQRLNALISLQNALHDVRAAHWFCPVVSLLKSV